jgi:hypothetical protein
LPSSPSPSLLPWPSPLSQSSSSSLTSLTKHHRPHRHRPCRPHPLRRCPHAQQALVDRRCLTRAHVHRPHLLLPSQVDCCLFTPLAVGGGLGASSAPPIQRTHPTCPRRRSKNESPGLQSQRLRNSCPCTPKRPNLAIPARGACTSESTPRRGGRAGMVLFGAISVVPAMFASCCESVTHKSAVEST